MFESLKISVVFTPTGHNLVVDEGSEHLGLEETREEGPVPLWLVREERSLVEVHH